ncbi:MAG: hypothetical protein QOI95_3172 [Acidimicrobiaceae bacterium]|jgi:hypothetical protein
MVSCPGRTLTKVLAFLAVLAVACVVVPAVLIYRDVARHVDDPVHSDEPMRAAVWWWVLWPVGLFYWIRARRRWREQQR